MYIVLSLTPRHRREEHNIATFRLLLRVSPIFFFFSRTVAFLSHTFVHTLTHPRFFKFTFFLLYLIYERARRTRCAKHANSFSCIVAFHCFYFLLIFFINNFHLYFDTPEVGSKEEFMVGNVNSVLVSRKFAYSTAAHEDKSYSLRFFAFCVKSWL